MVDPSTKAHYHPFYCEENVWHLAAERARIACAEGDVVFITNRVRRVVFRCQSRIPTGVREMVWDYHVVWLGPRSDIAGRSIWDFDTSLPWPVSASTYIAESFPHRVGALAPLFRVVAANDFVADFASDRSHMRDSEGYFLEPPPAWPAIGEGSNLESYLGMQKEPGRLLTLAEFEAYVAH
jgi:protein N-terminal glutamine amidohydrolase